MDEDDENDEDERDAVEDNDDDETAENDEVAIFVSSVPSCPRNWFDQNKSYRVEKTISPGRFF